MKTQEEYTKKQLLRLAKRIRKLRIARGYTNYETFAYDKNIPRAQYGRYEKGQDLKFSSLAKLVKAFDISFEEFFKDFEKEENEHSC